MTGPKRIQRKRVKGWRMPVGAVSVCRPSIWGNPFTVADCHEVGFSGTDAELAARCVGAFDAWLISPYWRTNWDGPESEAARQRILDNLDSLRGKDLACWCALDAPCHADVLLRLANEVAA